MKNAVTRGERLRNLFVGLVVLGALALVLLPRFRLEAAPLPRFDLVAEAMPLPRPTVEAQAFLTGAPPLPASLQATLDARRAFFAGEFAPLEAAMRAGHDEYVSGRSSTNRAKAIVDSVTDTHLAGIDRCSDWLRALPDSYAAHWLCAAVWQAGAHSARGGKFASEVSAVRFALMAERLERSNALLQRALTLTPRPIEALIMLAANHHLDSRRQAGEAFLQRAEAVMPQHHGIHGVRMNYARPEWGGSDEAVRAAWARAKEAGVAESHLLDLEDRYIARPAKKSTPGAARAYWENAIRVHPTRDRLTGLLHDLVGLQNWHDALPVASRLIDAYPDDNSAYALRARIHKQLGQIEAARADYRMAAAMGHDLALQELIMAHIRGGLGLPGKSYGEVIELCRYGATLGSGVGANCIGSMHFEAAGLGLAFATDPAQGHAWHQLAARAEHFNSQFDLGWTLYTGRVPGVEAATAKKVGTFWLRRAAEQNHLFAKRKLEENGISPSEDVSPGLLDELGLAALAAWIDR